MITLLCGATARHECGRQGDECDLIQASPVPSGRYPPRRVALFPILAQHPDVEELLAERGIELSYETVRVWALKFGKQFAWNLRRRRPKPTARFHLDEMVVKIRGVRMYLWRVVDDEGKVLDMLVQKRRNKAAAVKILKRLLKNTGIHPEAIVTDGLYSYKSAVRVLGCADQHRPGRLRENNRAENSTSRSGFENERCDASNRKARRRGFSPLTPPSTTRSTPLAISPRAERCESSGRPHGRSGTRRPRLREF